MKYLPILLLFPTITNDDQSKVCIGGPPRTLKLTLTGASGGFAYASENLDNPAKPKLGSRGDLTLPVGERGYDHVEVHKISQRSFSVRSKLHGQVVDDTTYRCSTKSQKG